MGPYLDLRALGIVALGAALLILNAPVAHADDNSEARVLFERGNRRFTRAMGARGNRRRRLLGQAVEAYVSSLGRVRSKNVLFNAALALKELGRFTEAYTYLQEYLAIADVTEAERREARRHMLELEAQVTLVTVRSTPPGATVHVDRRDLAARGTTPLTVALQGGDHQLLLSMPGFNEVHRALSAVAGEQATVEVQLEAQPVSVIIDAPTTGRLTIDGRAVTPGQAIRVVPGQHTIRFEPAVEQIIRIEPGSDPVHINLHVPDAQEGGSGRLALMATQAATVMIDGAVIGEGVNVDATLATGRHRLRVLAPGFAPAESEIDIQPGATVAVQVDLVPSSQGETTLGAAPAVAWITAGVVATAWAVVGARALSFNSDYEDVAKDPMATGAARQTAYDEVNAANRLADGVLIALLSTAAIATALSLFNSDTEQAPSTVSIGVAPRPGGAQVAAAWSLP